jgi:septal ring factor EnvC (AmiA/AmiB activator)
MTMNMKSPEPGFGDRTATFAARLARFVLRLLFVLVIGVGLGLAIYFGVPAVYRKYVEPVQANTERLDEMEAALAADQEQSRADRAALDARLAEIEGQLAQQTEALAALQSDVSAHANRLRDLSGLPDRLDALESEMEDTATRLAALEASLADAESPTQRLGRRLEMVRALEALTRARLWLTQDNLGLAADDIQMARDILARVAEEGPETEASVLTPIIARLDLALQDLPDSPVVASDDLDIAWGQLAEAAGP